VASLASDLEAGKTSRHTVLQKCTALATCRHCSFLNIGNMSKSCKGLLKNLVHCLRDSDCVKQV
jgi:hypothetical protein